MNRKWRSVLMLAVSAMLIVALGGCVSLTPDDILPKSIAPAGNDRHIDGSINVQAFVPDISKGKVYLLDNGSLYDSGPEIERGRVALGNMFDSSKLRAALEKAIAQKGLFRRIEKGDADYVLDVWVIDAIRRFKAEGMTIEMTAIWRLIRATDGKVIICDFTNGHGASHAFGANAAVQATQDAAREMIEKGLLVLSDSSKEHLSALSMAGLRSSMGPAMPEGFTQWSGNVRQNWSKLRMGLTIDEVETFIGPVETSGAIVNYYTKGYSQMYETGIYTLVFINGKLSRWELR
jgi:ABC-type uncharacterized transport system auxiliary subunit